MKLPLSPILQARANAEPKAKEFCEKYLKLCAEYNAEIRDNPYGVTCVFFDGGLSFSVDSFEFA